MSFGWSVSVAPYCCAKRFLRDAVDVTPKRCLREAVGVTPKRFLRVAVDVTPKRFLRVAVDVTPKRFLRDPVDVIPKRFLRDAVGVLRSVSAVVQLDGIVKLSCCSSRAVKVVLKRVMRAAAESETFLRV